MFVSDDWGGSESDGYGINKAKDFPESLIECKQKQLKSKIQKLHYLYLQVDRSPWNEEPLRP